MNRTTPSIWFLAVALLCPLTAAEMPLRWVSLPSPQFQVDGLPDTKLEGMRELIGKVAAQRIGAGDRHLEIIDGRRKSCGCW